MDRIVLKRGLGKDGNEGVQYVRDHPTNYHWQEDIERLTKRLVNDERFRRKIWINTYFHHPPGRPQDDWRWRDHTSFDVWGFGGRGDTLPKEIGERVKRAIFNDPDPPNIWWIIWAGKMWVDGEGWGPAPDGPPDSDPGHHKHIHVTYLDA